MDGYGQCTSHQHCGSVLMEWLVMSTRVWQTKSAKPLKFPEFLSALRFQVCFPLLKQLNDLMRRTRAKPDHQACEDNPIVKSYCRDLEDCSQKVESEYPCNHYSYNHAQIETDEATSKSVGGCNDKISKTANSLVRKCCNSISRRIFLFKLTDQLTR